MSRQKDKKTERQRQKDIKTKRQKDKNTQRQKGILQVPMRCVKSDGRKARNSISPLKVCLI